MLNILLFDLMFKLQGKMPDVFTGEVPTMIARQLENGMVVWGEGEYEYNGITDQNGNYFYLREKESGKSIYNEIENLSTCCSKTYTVSSEIRLVAVYKKFEAKTIEYKIVNQLTGGICIDKIPHASAPHITLTQSYSDFESIFKEETKQDADGFDKGHRLTAIDFKLTYQKTYDSCNKIENCCEINYETFCRLLKENGSLTKLIAKLKELNS